MLAVQVRAPEVGSAFSQQSILPCYSVRLAFRKDFNKPVRGTKCNFWVNLKGDFVYSFVGAVKPRSKGCSSQMCTQQQRSSGPVASVCSKSLPDAENLDVYSPVGVIWR